MSATESSMLPLGTQLPAFSLTDAVSGRAVDARSAPGRHGLLVMFICNHCPYVVHVRAQLIAVAHRALESGVAALAINSNSVRTHPQDGPSHMAELAKAEGWRFPFAFDDTQAVAKLFKAACTPDLFLFDAKRQLVYRGQFDDSRPSNGKPVTGADLQQAIDAMLLGKAPLDAQKPSIGCNIKWHPAA